MCMCVILQEELQRVFEGIDEDENGLIDYKEFQKWWESMNYFDVMGR